MKKRITIPVIFSLCALVSLAGCSQRTVEWNGETEYYANVFMVFDETNMYEYAGAVDYVFAATVEEVVSDLIPDVPNGSDEDLSYYRLRVDKNIKGALAETVECAKHGGFRKDGTMMLICSDSKYDTGLPEVGRRYIFMAYAQPDGSLTLSEFFDDRPCDDELIGEYEDYCANEVPLDRERFVSSFDEGRQ